MEKQNKDNKMLKVGITHGDINGINYEIIIKSFQDQRLFELFTPILYGLSKAASYHRKALHLNDFNFNIIKSAEQSMDGKFNIVNVYDKEVKIELGKPSRKAGEMAFMSLEAAVKDMKKEIIDVIVTAPINKHSIQSAEFDFPGHTEYFAKRFDTTDYLMLMVSDQLRIGAVTGHIPLREVTNVLSEELIVSKIKVLNESLQKDFAIRKPRIAVLGINPHASDDGLIGNEEDKIINPALNKVLDEGLLVYGPYSADGFFGTSAYKGFDGILAMYHDQTMLPFKLLSFESGVNYTAGLPIIRTSPAHGTAYDIAGKNLAVPDSFRKAIYLALDIYKNRKMYSEINKNPLEIKIPEENDNSSE